eukprot:11464800-Alexandrium_andersonii.AAC.1
MAVGLPPAPEQGAKPEVARDGGQNPEGRPAGATRAEDEVFYCKTCGSMFPVGVSDDRAQIERSVRRGVVLRMGKTDAASRLEADSEAGRAEKRASTPSVGSTAPPREGNARPSG